MSKTVTIPTDGMNPFVVIFNGVKYVYTPGETVEVPDGVALEIEEYKRWREKHPGENVPPFGAQPDWNQNDPDAPDFVKNRTHYEEFKTIIEERGVHAWFDGVGFAASRIPQVGEKLTVTLNGNTYKCTAWEIDGNVCLGNGEALGGDRGENVPFRAGFVVNDEGGVGAFIATAMIGENTISIVDDSGNTLLEKTFNNEINVNEPRSSDDYSLDCSLIVGNTYKVVYDGVPYECVAWNTDDYICLGNGVIEGLEHSEDVPFLIGTFPDDDGWFWYLVFYGDGTHTVSVSEVAVHKLDPKYLPDDMATVDGKMDADNPVGTGSFSMGREEGSIVGEDSFSIGNATRATAKNAVSEGEGTVANFCNMKASGAYNDFSTYAETITAGSMSVPGSWYAATGTAYSVSENGFELEGTVNTLVELSAVPVGSYIITKLASNEESGNLTTGTKMYHILSNTPYGTRGSRNIEYEQHSLALADSNKKGAFIHVVGNGTSDTKRSNAHTLDWEGNAWYASDVYVGSTSGKNKDEGSKKLVANGDTEMILTSSTEGSTKKFKITVDDTGVITATEVTQ